MDIIQFSDPTRDQLLYSQNNKNFKEGKWNIKDSNEALFNNETIKSTLHKIFNLLFSWDRTI